MPSELICEHHRWLPLDDGSRQCIQCGARVTYHVRAKAAEGPSAPLPSGYNAGELSDADVPRLAAVLAPMYGEGSEVRWVLERVAALRADASLGAALLAALATVPQGEELTIYHGITNGEPIFGVSATRHYGATTDYNDATRALHTALASALSERGKT